MNKLIIKNSLEKLCEELNENRLQLREVSFTGGTYKAMAYAGLKKGDFYKAIINPDSGAAVEYANKREGKIVSMICPLTGAIQFIALFSNAKFTEAEDKIEQEKLEAQMEKEAAEKQAQIDSVRAQEEALTLKKKELGIEDVPSAPVINEGEGQDPESGENKSSENTENQEGMTSTQENQ